MKNALDQAFANFVAEDDYIGLWQIVININAYLDLDPKKVTLAETEKFWATLSDFMARMLTNGFIAVDLTKDGGYVAWPEQDPKQVMIKIRNLVIEANGNINDVMYGVWFHKIDKQPSA